MTGPSKKTQKPAFIYSCINCDYNTYNKTDYVRHLSTLKHKNHTNDDQMMTDEAHNSTKNAKLYYCICGKKYKYKQGLYVHRKSCLLDEGTKDHLETNTTIIINEENKNNNKNKNNNNNNNNINNNINNNNNNINNNLYECSENDLNYKLMFIEMMKQNKELQSTICELLPKVGNNNVTHNTHNLTNNINVSLFLNDNCKDAMNMSDFLQTIEVGLDDLFVTKKKGLIGGISNIFINHLNKIPLVQRPIWCTDKKRRRLFIKEDTWSEDIDNVKTTAAIKNVSYIQTKNITKYVKSKPNWIKNENDKDEYMAIIKTTTDPLEGKTNPIVDNLIETIHLSSDKREKLDKNHIVY